MRTFLDAASNCCSPVSSWRTYELTMSSLKMQELTPVMICIMKKCIATFTSTVFKFEELSKRQMLVASEIDAAPNEESSKKSTEAKILAIDHIFAVYERVCAKVDAGVISSAFKDDLLKALVLAIRHVKCTDSAERFEVSHAEHSVLPDLGQPLVTRQSVEQDVMPGGDENDAMISELSQWLEKEGKSAACLGKSVPSKRIRSNRQSSAPSGSDAVEKDSNILQKYDVLEDFQPAEKRPRVETNVDANADNLNNFLSTNVITVSVDANTVHSSDANTGDDALNEVMEVADHVVYDISL